MQESTSDEKDEKKHPQTPEPGDFSCTADQTGLESGPLNGEHIQYQGAGLILGSVHPSQIPFTQDRDHSSLPSIFTSPGHSLSPQGECFLFNTTAPGSNSLFANYTANSISTSLAVSLPIMVPVGVPGILSSRTAVGSVQTADLPVSGDSAAPDCTVCRKNYGTAASGVPIRGRRLSPKRKLRLMISEKTSRPPTVLQRKIC